MRRIALAGALLAAGGFLAAAQEAGARDRLDRPPRNSGYFVVTPDARLCPSPLCGGFFVSAVNRPNTRCADRSRQAACYVTDIDWSRSGLTAEQIAGLHGGGALLLRGRIRRTDAGALGKLGVFRAREVWQSSSPAARLLSEPAEAAEPDAFVRLSDTGVRCIADPCASIRETLLNRRQRRPIHDVDLSEVDADPAEIDAALEALFGSRHGLLAVGRHESFEGTAGTGIRFVATRFYLPVRPPRSET